MAFGKKNSSMILSGLIFIVIIAVALVVVLLQTKKTPTEMRARAANPCEAYKKGKPIPKPGLIGTIQSMKEDRFSMIIGGGPTTKVIVVCAGTIITNKSNAKLTYKNLAVGNKVTVAGNYEATTGMTILSTSITQNSKSPAPTPLPSIIEKQALYYNLSMQPGTSSVSYSFTYTGPPAKNFYIAMSTDPKMLTDVYVKFAEGPSSPVTENNPSKWDKYTCDRPLYWRVTTEASQSNWSKYDPNLMSPIAPGTIACL